MQSLNHFRYTILFFPITVYTDHKPLLGALRNPTSDNCLYRWAVSIQEFAITLKYIKGENNIFADALSRLPERKCVDLENECQIKLEAHSYCQVLSDSLPAELSGNENELHTYLPKKVPWSDDELRDAQQKDAACMDIINTLRGKEGGKKIPKTLFLSSRLVNGILYMVREIKRAAFSDMVIVPYTPDALMRDAFNITHQDIRAGHTGAYRTLKLLVKSFYNIRKRTYISERCAKCQTCIRAKGIVKPTPIKKYPIPIRLFHTVVSDIIGPLRTTEIGNKFILTFRDYLTRYTILYPLAEKSTANIIECMRKVISHYGDPNVLLTDNAKEYIAEQLKEFLRYYNTEKVEVARYHPSSAGFAERINREVNKVL